MWQYDWHEPQPLDGAIKPDGNLRNIFEKRAAPLCFTQKYYSPHMWGPDRVLNEPQRLTAQLRADRGNEALIFGARRWREARALKHEFPDRIAAANKREDEAHAERIRRTGGEKVRWWHTRHALSQRDSLKTVKMCNFSFNPERLVSSKEVVILNLTGCRLGDQELVWVSTFMQQNNTLRRLILQGNDITPKGIDQLAPGIAEAFSLIEIDFGMNPIGDHGLANLVVALSVNIRKMIISKLGLGACNLTPAATYHLVRLLRDFQTMQCLLLWRNNFGSSGSQYTGPDVTKSAGRTMQKQAGDDDMAGIGVLLEELRVNKNVRLVDLTSTNLSEGPLGQFATELERQAREKRIADVEHKSRAQRIVTMNDELERRREEAVFDDEKFAIIALEKELEAERAKFQEQLEMQETEKKKRTVFAIWRDKVMAASGRELIEMKRHVRLVLRCNPSVTPSTIKRLGTFVDVEERADYDEFLKRPRIYDNIVLPRRQVMAPGYSFCQPFDDYASNESKRWYDPFRFEDEYEREQRLRREQKRQELLELQRKGYDGAGTRYGDGGGGGDGSSSSPGRARAGGSTVLVDEDDVVEQNVAFVNMVEGYGLGENGKRARKVGAGSVAIDIPSPSAIAARANAAFGNSKTDEALATLEMNVDLEASNSRNRLSMRFDDCMEYLRDNQVPVINVDSLPPDAFRPAVAAGEAAAGDETANRAAALFSELYALAQSMKRLEMLANSGSAPIEAIQELESFLVSEKSRLTSDMAAVAAQQQPMLVPQSDVQAQLCVALLEDLLRQPAEAPGNAHLAQALLQTVSVPWAQILHARQLPGAAAALGNVNFFHLFLFFVDEHSVGDLDQMLALVSSHPTHRVPLSLLFVQKFASALALQRPALQQLLEDVASLRRELPGEVRGSNRRDLIRTLLSVRELDLQCSSSSSSSSAGDDGSNGYTAGSDGLEMWQRACYEGDAELLQLMAELGKISDFNATATDAGLHALSLAAFSDSVDAVSWLLLNELAKSVEANVVSRFGDNALDVAQSNRRSAEIINLLREKAGLTSKHDERIREAEAAAQAAREQRERELAHAQQQRMARGGRAQLAHQQAEARKRAGGSAF